VSIAAEMLARLDREDAARGAEVARRRQVLDRVARRITDLRGAPGSTALLDRICRDVVEVCAFSRVMLSRIEGEDWLPGASYATKARGAHDEAEGLRGLRIPLRAASVERAAVDARRAQQAGDSPAVLEGWPGHYVVAPVLAGDRVIGLLHCDHGGRDRSLGAFDREALELFASGFGHVYERTVLSERLRAQHALVEKACAGAQALSWAVAGAEYDLFQGALGKQRAVPDGGQVIGWAQATGLTARQSEILALVVAGHNSAEIAERLVIARPTVQSHVRCVLRKLGARNRTEAVAMYLTRDSTLRSA